MNVVLGRVGCCRLHGSPLQSFHEMQHVPSALSVFALKHAPMTTLRQLGGFSMLKSAKLDAALHDVKFACSMAWCTVAL